MAEVKKFPSFIIYSFSFTFKINNNVFHPYKQNLIFYRCPCLADRMHSMYWQFMKNNLQKKTTQRDINGEALQEYFVGSVPLLCYILRFVICTNTLVKRRKKTLSRIGCSIRLSTCTCISYGWRLAIFLKASSTLFEK